MNNIACRIFKEQIDLLTSLPNQEEAKTVLYQAVINSLNQFEKQNENQIENQFENAYVSESVSISVLGISILNLLSKNIIWKEFSNNYGGKRENSGRKSSNNNNINQDEKIKLIKSSCVNQVVDKDIDKEIDKEIYKENFEEWWSYYPKLRAGSKKKAYVKYKQAIIEDKLTPEFLLSKVKEYAESDEVKKGFACGAEVYFNKCKYNNQYNTGSDMDYLEKSLRELGL